MSKFDEHRLRQQAIGVKLRLLLGPVTCLPIPEEWLDLLRRADEREAEKWRR